MKRFCRPIKHLVDRVGASRCLGARSFWRVFWMVKLQVGPAPGLADEMGSLPSAQAMHPGEGRSMSAARDLDVDAIVARTLQALREAGLLLQRQPVEPPKSQGPTRGPRRCPQRARYKRVLQGPRARQPLRSGQHPPGLRTLLASRSGEGAWEEDTVPARQPASEEREERSDAQGAGVPAAGVAQ